MLPVAAQVTPVTRPTFWRIGAIGEALFYYLAAVAIAIFILGVVDRIRRYTRGNEEPIPRLDDLPGRVRSAARIVGTNATLLDRDRFAGVMHAFILWGFLTLLIGTTILAVDMDIYQKATGSSFFVGDFYLAYSLVMDALGFLFVVGVGMALYRRYWVHNRRLWGRHTSMEDDLFVWTLFILGVGGYLTEGVRILAQGYPSFETVSFVGWFVADALGAVGVSQATALSLYPVAWWSHALIALAFVAAIPYAKPFHMLSSFANVVARDERAGARIPGVPADLDADTGAETIDSFSWKQLLDQDACTKCGRCSAICPANASGRPLDPRDVILDLKRYREARDAGDESVPIVADGGSVIDPETMESCMACMACMDACPVEIEHLTSFTRMNRQLVDTGAVDSNVQDVFGDLMRSGNTFGEAQRSRGDWSEDLAFDVTDAREEAVEYLWYVGDYPSFDDRNKQVARALARIFEHADVSYGILFDDETYDGNDIRRLGEEFLYVDLAGRLVESFETCEFEQIVCTDPHSFNTFRNEYPEVAFEEFADDPMMEFEIDGRWNVDGDVEVHHYTQVVADLIEAGRVDLAGDELDYTVTYHDPCHLGRYNGVYEPPRAVVEATGCDLNEMPRNRDDSFCCGGGGGGVWMEIDEDTKPSEERLREATEDTAAGEAVERFLVACPMCVTMFEDGRKTGGFEESLEVVDLAELVCEALETAGAIEPAAA